MRLLPGKRNPAGGKIFGLKIFGLISIFALLSGIVFFTFTALDVQPSHSTVLSPPMDAPDTREQALNVLANLYNAPSTTSRKTEDSGLFASLQAWHPGC
jgi:hypothetical protein